MISGKVWNSFWKIAYDSEYPYAIVEDGWAIAMHPHWGIGVFSPAVIRGSGWVNWKNIYAIGYPLVRGAMLTRLTVDGWKVEYALDDGEIVAAPFTGPHTGAEPLKVRDVWRRIEPARFIGRVKKYGSGRFRASAYFILTTDGLVPDDGSESIVYSGEYLCESHILRGKEVDMSLTARDVLVLRAAEGNAFFTVAPVEKGRSRR